MTKYLTLAQENLRDLQIEEGKRRELFGPEEDGLEDSYENALGRLDAEHPPTSDDLSVATISDGEKLSLGRLPDFGWSEELEHLRRSTMTERLTPYAKLIARVNNPTFQDTFREIFDEAFDLLVERQRKYGPENIRKLGLYGVFTRIEDKMERIRHSFQGGMKDGVLDIQEVNATNDETLDDADFDAANYHLIRIALRRGVWGRPLGEEGDE